MLNYIGKNKQHAKIGNVNREENSTREFKLCLDIKHTNINKICCSLSADSI